MTTQGAGRPFALREPIEGWRACEVTGGAYTGPGGDGSEVLRALTPGTAAAFRWLELARPATAIELVARGHGVVEICVGADRRPVGVVEVSEGEAARGRLELPPGRHEVWLRGGSDGDVEVTTFVLS
jgi:hypothetical protein